MTGGDFEVDPVRAGALADEVSGIGQTVFGEAEGVRAKPDAGRSTDEVAAAFGDLGAIVAGLADLTGQLADAADVAAGRYASVDEAARSRMQDQAGAIGP